MDKAAVNASDDKQLRELGLQAKGCEGYYKTKWLPT